MSDNDPFAFFARWFAEAQASEPNDPNAMTVATTNQEGHPSARIVLLKEWDEKGFVFYTNKESRKGGELSENPRAALLFFWKSLHRQIRIEGTVEHVTDAEADAYYASRSLKSRLGAWASAQSQPLSSRGALMAEVAKVTLQQGANPSRPPFWGGFRITPVEIEFWADGPFRLHDRFRWTRPDSAAPWVVERLNP